MIWRKLKSFLNFCTYLYLLRFPILTGTVFFALPLFAWFGGAKMLAGAFDQWIGRQILALTLMDIIMFWTLLVTGHLVIDYSQERSSAPPFVHKVRWRRIWTALSALAAMPTLTIAYRYSSQDVKPWTFVLFVLLGVLLAALILTLVHLLRRIFVPPGHAPFDETIPLLVPKSFAARAERYGGFENASKFLLSTLKKLPDYLTRGYLDTSHASARLLPGHGLAVALSGGFLAVYLLIGVLHCGTAIVYVIVLLTTLCWLLSGLAFLLDLFRVPVLTVLALLLIAAAYSPNSDHYFNLSKPSASYFGPKAAEYIVAERPGAQDCPIIVVSANGGGIQCAAWTAKVLTGLAEQFEKQGEPNLDRFLRSIRLISGVSGGSVGTMFFVNEIQAPGSGTRTSFKNVVEEAEDSGLAEVVWGMAYPDFLHAFFPWFRRNLLLDRGHALEETWVKSAKDHLSPSLATGLLEWNRGVEEGWRPATIFNSTFAESGERLQISTIPAGTKAVGRKEFFYLYEADIRIATAARLSATFPYVSPATRPFYGASSPVFHNRKSDYDHLHAVDGGYFDNSGLCALTEWLNEALEERAAVQKRTAVHPPVGREKILVIEIRGFPEGIATYPKIHRGWFYQMYAPVSTLIGVWTSGQAAANETEFGLLQAYWAQKGVDIEPVIFQPDDSVYAKAQAEGQRGLLPLSWHLRKIDKDMIESAWSYECQRNANCQRVLDFVGRPP